MQVVLLLPCDIGVRRRQSSVSPFEPPTRDYDAYQRQKIKTDRRPSRRHRAPFGQMLNGVEIELVDDTVTKEEIELATGPVAGTS